MLITVSMKRRLYVALANLTFQILIIFGLTEASTVAHYMAHAVLITSMARAVLITSMALAVLITYMPLAVLIKAVDKVVCNSVTPIFISTRACLDSVSVGITHIINIIN